MHDCTCRVLKMLLNNDPRIGPMANSVAFSHVAMPPPYSARPGRRQCRAYPIDGEVPRNLKGCQSALYLRAGLGHVLPRDPRLRRHRPPPLYSSRRSDGLRKESGVRANPEMAG